MGLLGRPDHARRCWSLAADPLSQAMVGFFNVLPLQLGTLGRDTAVIVLATGLGLGVLGSWVSVRTYLIR